MSGITAAPAFWMAAADPACLGDPAHHPVWMILGEPAELDFIH